MQKLFPIFKWLSDYERSWLKMDVPAGLTIGIVLIPQGMAYAMIAGLPPVYGLYAALVPLLIYVIMGTSPQLAVGPVALDSILVASGLGALSVAGEGEEMYIALALLLTFMVGVIQLALGLLRMGFLVNLLSRPVITGFTSAAAFIIMFSQMKHIIGTQGSESREFTDTFMAVMQQLPETHYPTLAVGAAGILLIVLLRQLHSRIPGILVVVALALIVSAWVEFRDLGIAIVGSIPEGFPSPGLPSFKFKYINQLFPTAATLALIGFAQAMTISQALAEKKGTDVVKPNRELIALGTANLLGSIFSSYTVTGSFSRSAINNKMHAKTLLSSLVSVLMVAATLMFLTPVFYYLPNAILASIIMVSVIGLVEIHYPMDLWKHQRDEFYLLVFTFFATLFVGIIGGLLLGVLLAFVIMLYRSSKPHFAVLGKVKGSEYYKNINRFSRETEVREDLLIIRFDDQLFFGNKNYFKKQLRRAIQGKGDELRAVILNAETMNYMDSSATSMLVKFIKELKEKDIRFYISGAIGPLRDILFHSGVIDEIPKEHFFLRIQEAVDYFDHDESASTLQERLAYENKSNGNPGYQ